MTFRSLYCGIIVDNSVGFRLFACEREWQLLAMRVFSWVFVSIRDAYFYVGVYFNNLEESLFLYKLKNSCQFVKKRHKIRAENLLFLENI